MPRFTICAPGQAEPVSELVANDPGSILNIICRIGCREADISRDGVYSFSARLDANEVWTIFERSGRGKERRSLAAAGIKSSFLVVREAGSSMDRLPGRPVKARIAVNRDRVLATLNADIERFDRTTAKEAQQQRTGQREPARIFD